ncbi:hypothetical protein ACJJTC_019535 [Scirpophaga incertulas]
MRWLSHYRHWRHSCDQPFAISYHLRPTGLPSVLRGARSRSNYSGDKVNRDDTLSPFEYLDTSIAVHASKLLDLDSSRLTFILTLCFKVPSARRGGQRAAGHAFAALGPSAVPDVDARDLITESPVKKTKAAACRTGDLWRRGAAGGPSVPERGASWKRDAGEGWLPNIDCLTINRLKCPSDLSSTFVRSLYRRPFR